MSTPCNEMRCVANEVMSRIVTGPFTNEEKISQLEILLWYAEACIKKLKAKPPQYSTGESK